MIDVGFKTIAYIKQRIHQEVEELCWQILLLLLKRGELQLINIGFSKAQKNKILNNTVDEVVKAKIDIAIQYLELMNALL